MTLPFSRRFCLGLVLLLGAQHAVSAAGLDDIKRDQLYNPTNLWKLHLKLSKEQYDAMQPKRLENSGFRFGPPGGGPGGPAGGPPPPDRPMSLVNTNSSRNGLAGVIGFDFNWVKGDLEFEGAAMPDVAVRYKGNGTYMGSQNDDKRPMKVDLNKHAKGRRLAGIDRLNLANNSADASFMTDVISYELFRAAGIPAPRAGYARVSMTVPGMMDNKYLGLYTLVETVDSAFEKLHFGTKKGVMFKPVTPTLFEYQGDDWADYKRNYDAKDEISAEQQKRVIEMARFVTKATDEEFAAKAPDYVDIDNFSRFMAMMVLQSSYDSILAMGQNFYMYLHPVTQKFSFIPWDLDHSLGEFPMLGTPEQRLKADIMHPWVGDITFLSRMFKVPAFTKAYRERLKEFASTIYQGEKVSQRADKLAAIIRPSIAEESPDKLKRFEETLSTEPPKAGQAPAPGPRFGRPGGPGGFGGPAHQFKVFVANRSKNVLEQLDGKTKGEIVTRGGPGGPGGGFGPGNFLAGQVVNQADTDMNGTVSKAEWDALTAKWAAAWDADKSGGMSQEEVMEGVTAAFPPPPGFGPPGGGRGPGGPRFGPGMFVGPSLTAKLDKDKNGQVSPAEFTEGFAGWFGSWDKEHKGGLSEDNIRDGINKDWAGGPGGPGGPPGGGPGRPGGPGFPPSAGGPPGPRPPQ